MDICSTVGSKVQAFVFNIFNTVCDFVIYRLDCVIDVVFTCSTNIIGRQATIGAKLITLVKTTADTFKVFDLVFVLPFAISDVATHAPIEAFQMTL
ncbi:hypothetical protein ABLU02_17780 [Acinetobacter nosocomialis]|nr:MULTISPECIES: hypothetical protein [unclassified Acinetobacter]